ncbi:hypothetical protein HBI56_171500 [Parastagonospora nodorum]|uniref:Uncharacterized protein n=1 Tax=Phaeosphaeria nodorum (strain SN15 / ATCC MYA-4574 / FGSC 10173) TaxID=321614 RepID=A0A7U2I0D1_PHANO|nr:hypothetical protein HBH53_157890 [Parastagonospora nodorum]QRC97079.1 hypothetical protein JI435_410060 [Parastagonospora nodorum SN15]KAH3959340.1 hypothetical protein HBH52_244690 [Parastagonospora nodorum]KAH3995008.1 hypothetical protein HBI10_175350 [Parastagonospora nodorum]KAH4012658.1 hypothetical protein HBI09_221620 [Parastagonospora nodorum]
MSTKQIHHWSKMPCTREHIPTQKCCDDSAAVLCIYDTDGSSKAELCAARVRLLAATAAAPTIISHVGEFRVNPS